MEKTTNPFTDDNFARHVGIELIDAAKGSARAKLDICEHHLNGPGCVHGGAIFTLAVWTMAVATYQVIITNENKETVATFKGLAYKKFG